MTGTEAAASPNGNATRNGRYGAVVFDLFGTLVQPFSMRRYQRAVAEMARCLSVAPDRFGPLWIDATWEKRKSGGFADTEANIREVCQRLSSSPTPAAVRSAAQVRLELTRRALVPKADALDTLRELKRSGKRLGLVTDCAPDVPLVWHETPFATLIDAPVFSCRAGMCKPDERIYRLACAELGVPPERCLFVGDGSNRELSGARDVGMDAVLVRVPLDDVYDAHRDDVGPWTGPEVRVLNQVLRIAGCPA